MPDMPETVTLEWIGRALVGLQQDVRGVKDEIRGVNDRLAAVETEQRELRGRFDVFETQVSAALFRADANWRETREEVSELRGDVRGLRTACEEVLRQLRLKSPATTYLDD